MRKPLLPVGSLLLCAFSFATSLFAQPTSLKTSLEEISRTIPADVGIAVINLQTHEMLAINGDERFPMQSVFKFHIALAALHLVDEGKLFLEQISICTICIGRLREGIRQDSNLPKRSFPIWPDAHRHDKYCRERPAVY